MSRAKATGLDLSTQRLETPDGAQLAYSLRPGPGPLVVLSHPHSGSQEVFCDLLEVWHGNALTWDRRGYGGSTRGRQYDTRTQDDDLRHLLDALGIASAVLVGVAAGGKVSAGFAARWPDRVLGLGFASSFIGEPVSFWRGLTGEPAPTGDIAEQELSEAFRASPKAGNWRAIARRNQAAGAGEPPQPCAVSLAALREISPLALATGALDLLFTPDMLTAASGLLPYATATVFKDAAHAPQVETPQTMANWLDALISRV